MLEDIERLLATWGPIYGQTLIFGIFACGLAVTIFGKNLGGKHWLIAFIGISLLRLVMDFPFSLASFLEMGHSPNLALEQVAAYAMPCSRVGQALWPLEIGLLAVFLFSFSYGLQNGGAHHPKPMSLLGNASRSEFWYMWLTCGSTNSLAILSLSNYYTGTKLDYVTLIVPLATAVFFGWILFATYVKRWHDLNKSGWWNFTLFVPFVGVVAFLYMGFASGRSDAKKVASEKLQPTFGQTS